MVYFKPGEVEVMLKGALDQVINSCIGFLEGGIYYREFTTEYRSRILQIASSLGNSGLRSFIYKYIKIFHKLLLSLVFS